MEEATSPLTGLQETQRDSIGVKRKAKSESNEKVGWGTPKCN